VEAHKEAYKDLGRTSVSRSFKRGINITLLYKLNGGVKIYII